jgi:predicted HAD superfamily phosphohydrolase YqeG
VWQKVCEKFRMTQPRAIFVDCDGTLHAHGRRNDELFSWLTKRKGEGFRLFLWSSRGDEHATAVARDLGCLYLFTAALPKPCAIVDDQGWGWTRYAPPVLRFDQE